MSLYYLSDMNTRQVQELQKTCSLALLPIGPTEVHSYYLPTRTDVALAEEVAYRAAAKLERKGIPALIAPSISYCVAAAAHVFPGNTCARPETVSALIEDVCLSLSKWNFSHILILSGHGEPRNTKAILEGARNAMAHDKHLDARLSEWTTKGMARAERFMKSEHPELEIHAGEHEVALIMYRYPELVDREALSTMEPNWADPSFWEKVSTPGNTYTFPELGAPDAYFGNPRVATPETGDKVFDIVSDFAVEEALAMLGK